MEFDFEGQQDLITELTQDGGNRDGLRVQKKPFCTRAQEKGAVTPQETEPDLPLSVQESAVEAWVDSGLPQGQGH